MRCEEVEMAKVSNEDKVKKCLFDVMIDNRTSDELSAMIMEWSGTINRCEFCSYHPCSDFLSTQVCQEGIKSFIER